MSPFYISCMNVFISIFPIIFILSPILYISASSPKLNPITSIFTLSLFFNNNFITFANSV